MGLRPGIRLGAYEIVSLLGRGGMGEVYRATDTKLGRDVALKILPDAFTNDPERLARFRREARVLASLNHPHIGAIYDFEEAGDIRFLVLELVGGDRLDQRMARGTVSIRDALEIAAAIAEALHAAHQQGIVHRDLKPANIAFSSGNEVKVLDFGLAIVRPRGAGPPSGSAVTGLEGTLDYMSPEQTKGSDIDARSDIYALGVITYELIACRLPYDLAGKTVIEKIASIQDDSPSPLIQIRTILREELEAIVFKALEKTPGHRYPSADVMRRDLAAVIDSATISVMSPLARLRAKGRRLTPATIDLIGLWEAVVCGLLALVHVGFFLLLFSHMDNAVPAGLRPPRFPTAVFVKWAIALSAMAALGWLTRHNVLARWCVLAICVAMFTLHAMILADIFLGISIARDLIAYDQASGPLYTVFWIIEIGALVAAICVVTSTFRLNALKRTRCARVSALPDVPDSNSMTRLSS